MMTLKELRHDRHLTLEQASAQIGVPLPTLSAYERGARMPRLVTGVKIADYYQVDVREIADFFSESRYTK